MTDLSDLEAGWLAGLLEGEAWFGTTNGAQPAIKVAMVDRDVIERVGRLLDRPVRVYPPRGERHQQVYYVFISGWPAVDVMRRVRPYMGLRRSERIDTLVEAQEASGRYRVNGDVCHRGHRWTPATTYRNPTTGYRLCKLCQQENRRRVRREAHVV